jgi:hypothetical protein
MKMLVLTAALAITIGTAAPQTVNALLDYILAKERRFAEENGILRYTGLNIEGS